VKHVAAVIIKLIIITVILEILLNMLTDLTFSEILYVSAAVTILAYIIGDLLILPLSNNTVATIADIGLALFTIYAFNYLWNVWEISFIDALISAAAIGVAEWFFHKYMATTVLPNGSNE
jgi:hypothetical protein